MAIRNFRNKMKSGRDTDKPPRRSCASRRRFFRRAVPSARLNPVTALIRDALPAGLLFSLPVAPAFSAPQGGTVVDGLGSITTPDMTTTTINQRSQNLIVNWQSFNVNVDETVNFNQPNANARALNRIYDQSPSQIYGQINANGAVILVNPNGVWFTSTSRVDVGSLIASGLNISDEDFMSGNYQFANADGSEGGMVVNQGLLQAATGGSVNLLGGAVRNEGSIIAATAGQVNLVAGKKITMDFDGDGLLQFIVDEAVLKNAHELDSAISNTGVIKAPGGSVLLKAETAKDIFSYVVNNSGIVNAGRIQNKGGVIKLVATGEAGSLINTGILDASSDDGDGGDIELYASDKTFIVKDSHITAASSSGKGGKVTLTGDSVGLFDTTTVDASGKTGGGEILIGGDYQGANADVPNARYTLVTEAVAIKADAASTGDGGRVIIWADDVTSYHGTISAKGGTENGDGGFAEVSGKENLVYRGLVDLTALNGEMGTLLLDPKNIFVGTAPTCGGTCDATTSNITNINQTATFASNIFVADSEDMGIRVVDLVNALAGADVVLQANNDITIDAAVDASGNNNGGDLSLRAGRSIDINANITLEGSFFATVNDAGDQTTPAVVAQRDSGDASFDSTGFTIDTSDTSGTTHDITIQYGSLAGTPTMAAINIGTLNAGATGNITIAGSGVSGVATTVTVNSVTNADNLTLTNIGGTATLSGDVDVTTLTVDSSNNDVAFTGNGSSVTNMVAFANTGTLTLGQDSGTQTYNGGLMTTAVGTATVLNGTIETSGDTMVFGAVELGSEVSLDTGGGDISINGTLDGKDQDLVLDAGIGAGSVTVTGAVSNLGDGTGAALTVQSGVTGLVDFQGVFGGNSGVIAASGSTVRFAGDVTLADGDTGSSFAALALSGPMTWSGYDGLMVTGATTLSGGTVTLDSNGGAISLASITGGGQDLVLGAGIGAGSVTVTGAVSNLGDGTGAALTVQSGVTGLVDFQGVFGGNSGVIAASGTRCVLPGM